MDHCSVCLHFPAYHGQMPFEAIPAAMQEPQVWVLMGGEGGGRQDALAAGRSAYLALSGTDTAEIHHVFMVWPSDPD